MKKKYKPGDPEIYQQISEGLSYHQTAGEVYHTNRSKVKFHRLYLAATKNMFNPKVLDVGCGVGTELFMLPKLPGGKYVGVDISRPAIITGRRLAVQRGEYQVRFKHLDANKKLPFPPNSFSVIYALELIEHIKEPGEFLDEARRLLRPHGRLILSTPNGESLPNRLLSLFSRSFFKPISLERMADFTRHGSSFGVDASVWDIDAHISLFGFSKWKRIFQEHGFEIDQVEGSSFFGGSRFISNRPFLLGLAILIDSLVDVLPFKPHFQMCLIVSLKKNAG